MAPPFDIIAFVTIQLLNFALFVTLWADQRPLYSCVTHREVQSSVVGAVLYSTAFWVLAGGHRPVIPAVVTAVSLVFVALMRFGHRRETKRCHFVLGERLTSYSTLLTLVGAAFYLLLQ